jgi:hypothetical protein
MVSLVKTATTVCYECGADITVNVDRDAFNLYAPEGGMDRIRKSLEKRAAKDPS